MKLTRKKAIELCIELWTWLAKTGKRKYEWPGWEKDENDTTNNCFFCEYQYQRSDESDYEECHYCPLYRKFGHCEKKTYYSNWRFASSNKEREKYAKLLLGQIQSVRSKK